MATGHFEDGKALRLNRAPSICASTGRSSAAAGRLSSQLFWPVRRSARAMPTTQATPTLRRPRCLWHRSLRAR